MAKRKYQIGIPVNKKEKDLIKANAKLNKYKSMASFLRDRGLETDISNKACLAIMMSWLSFHMKDLSQDASLNWINRKEKILNSVRPELADMKPKTRTKYLNKLSSVLDHSKKMQSELEELLKGRLIE